MYMPNQNKILKSELRQDLVTGDWVVIAPKRKKRPTAPFQEARYQIKKEAACVFCDPAKFEQEKDVLIYYDQKGNWTTRVFPNKYPAFQKGTSLNKRLVGPYFACDSTGFHEIIVTRDHKLSLADLASEKVAEVLRAYQERYIKLMNKKFVDYISIFHNHGRTAGASVAHPHSQLAAMPFVSMDVAKELSGAENYFAKNQECVYCRIIAEEIARKERLVFQNDDFVVFCPFASRMGYEMWLAPKEHQPYFERLEKEEREKAGEALKVALAKISRLLDNQDYNFYLHTAPCDGKIYSHYHWHIEILPKYSTWAGFELGTGIEINPVLPETAAAELRSA